MAISGIGILVSFIRDLGKDPAKKEITKILQDMGYKKKQSKQAATIIVSIGFIGISLIAYALSPLDSILGRNHETIIIDLIEIIEIHY